MHASTPQAQHQPHQQIQQQQQMSTPTTSGAKVTLRRASQSTITRPEKRGMKRKSPEAEPQQDDGEVEEVDPLEISSPDHVMFEEAILTLQRVYQDLNKKNKKAKQEYHQERKGLNKMRQQLKLKCDELSARERQVEIQVARAESMSEILQEAQRQANELRIKLSVAEKRIQMCERNHSGSTYRNLLSDNNVPQTPRHNAFEETQNSVNSVTSETPKKGSAS